MKHILFGITLSSAVLMSSPVFAAATWMPEFEQGKAVYVDPSLSGHSDAPYNFSPKLEQQLAQQSQQGLQYFVVAAQQGNEAIPPGASLGPASADKLLSKWSNVSAFPKENYAVIFWVRKNKDLNTGSVGVNTGKLGRDNGVTTDLLSDPNGLVIPALKSNMPANPEGAMQEIVSNIETQVSENRIAVQQEKERAAKREADKKEIKERRAAAVESVLTLLMWGTPIGALFFGLMTLHLGRKKNKAEAEEAIGKWERLCKSSSEVYCSVQADELPWLETLPFEKDTQLRSDFDALVSKLAEFISWSNTANELLEQAKNSANQGKYLEVVKELSDGTVTVQNASIPVTLANLKTGMDVEEEIPATELKNRLETKWEDIRILLNDLSSYRLMLAWLSDDSVHQSFACQYDDEHHAIVNELNTYRLGEGEGFLAPLEPNPALDAFKAKAQEVQQLVEAAKIREAIQVKEQAQRAYRQAAQQIHSMFSDKVSSEQLATVLTQSSKLSQEIIEAQEAVTVIQREFPAESTDDLKGAVQEATDFSQKKKDEFKIDLIGLYQKRRFDMAAMVLERIKGEFEKAEEELGYVIDSPARIRSQRDELNRMTEVRRENGNLNSRYRVTSEQSDWDLLSLAVLQSQLSSFESSVSDASRQQRQEQSYAHSSTSDYESYSSDSDYGSYSSGGDYGDFSGGGDY